MGSCSRRNGKALVFPVETPSFMTIIHQNNLEHGRLGIPKSAVMTYGDRLGDTMCLKCPNGQVWPIGLKRHNGRVWLLNGWSKFAEHYSLANAYVLLFNSEGVQESQSNFQVQIFSRTTVEIDYSKSSRAENQSVESDDEVQEIKRTQYRGGEGTSTGKRRSRACGRPNIEEIKKSFKSTNPILAIEMQPSYIKTHLKLNASFIMGHICLSGLCHVTLQISDGRTWTVECSVSAHQQHNYARFKHGGWQAFVTDNQVEEGDVLVLELIDHRTFKAHIIRLQQHYQGMHN